MIADFKYYASLVIGLPLLPVMLYQGIRIRRNVPKLPEANHPSGKVIKGNDRNLRILALGESTIAGVGVNSHRQGFTGHLADALSDDLNCTVDWTVIAKSGYTVQQMSTRLIPRIKDEKFDMILIGAGGNDAFQLNSPSKWRTSVTLLLSELNEKQPGTPIVFLNMPPIKDFPAFTSLIKNSIGNLVRIFGTELSRIVNRHENVYFNSELITFENWIIKKGLTNDISVFFSDGVHPSELTYKIWAQEMSRFIVQEKKILS